MTEAKKYASKRVSSTDYPVYNDEYELELAFEEGAKWQKNHVWHKLGITHPTNNTIMIMEANEDEKIKYELILYLTNELNNVPQLTPRTNEYEKWIAWLRAK